MIEAGMSFSDGDTRFTYLQTAAETAGELHEQRVEYGPGSRFPLTHVHPDQDEFFAVERGCMVFEIAGARRVVVAGETIRVPRRTQHRARNGSATEVAVVRWETRPALRTGEFFVQAAKIGSGSSPLDGALLAHEYRDVFRPSGLVGLLVPVIARVARVAGRRLAPLDRP